MLPLIRLTDVGRPVLKIDAQAWGTSQSLVPVFELEIGKAFGKKDSVVRNCTNAQIVWGLPCTGLSKDAEVKLACQQVEKGQ